jgi:type III pantothenate kinase
MLLAIDIGNSKTHCGLFRNKKLIRQWSINTKDVIDGKWDCSLKGVSEAVVCSVVPEAVSAIKQNLKIPVLFVNSKIDLGFKIKYKAPEKVGADRIANTAGVKFLYGYPALVVDFGTAITIDVVSKSGDYLGGVIMPGLDIIRQGLNAGTALLPLVNVMKPRKVLGATTEEAIQSGMYYGIRGMIKQLILDIKKELHLSDKTVIINTGGYSHIWGKGTGKVDRFLTLKGLRVLYERNRTKLNKY